MRKNDNIEQVKKEYVSPEIEVVACQSKACLLDASDPVNNPPKTIVDWDDDD